MNEVSTYMCWVRFKHINSVHNDVGTGTRIYSGTNKNSSEDPWGSGQENLPQQCATLLIPYRISGTKLSNKLSFVNKDADAEFKHEPGSKAAHSIYTLSIKVG